MTLKLKLAEAPVGSFYGISKTGAYSLNYAGAVDVGGMQK